MSESVVGTCTPLASSADALELPSAIPNAREETTSPLMKIAFVAMTCPPVGLRLAVSPTMYRQLSQMGVFYVTLPATSSSNSVFEVKQAAIGTNQVIPVIVEATIGGDVPTESEKMQSECG